MRKKKPIETDIAEEWLDTPTAEAHTGIELRTRRVRGNGPPYSKAGGRVVYSRRDLDEWLRSLRVRSTSESAMRDA